MMIGIWAAQGVEMHVSLAWHGQSWCTVHPAGTHLSGGNIAAGMQMQSNYNNAAGLRMMPPFLGLPCLWYSRVIQYKSCPGQESLAA